MATAAAHAPAIAGVEDPYRDRYLIAIAVTLASVLELVDTSIVNVAIPDMMGNLGATLDEIAWVSTGYIIANVIVIPMSSVAPRFPIMSGIATLTIDVSTSSSTDASVTAIAMR